MPGGQVWAEGLKLPVKGQGPQALQFCVHGAGWEVGPREALVGTVTIPSLPTREVSPGPKAVRSLGTELQGRELSLPQVLAPDVATGVVFCASF